jgi:hypothetical protein
MVDDKIKPEDENEETVVELEGEETEEASAEPVEHEDRAEAKADDDELENYSESVQKRINRLTKKMREAERREQEALAFAQGVKGEMDSLKTRMKELDTSYSTEYEGRVTSQLDAAKRAFKEAYEAGDVDKMAEAQQLMSKITIDQERLRLYRQNQPKEEAAAAPQQQTASQQAAPRPTPDAKAQVWAERNEWFGTDERMTHMAFITHRELVEDEGFDPSSNEYYDELDRRMRRDFPNKFSANDESKPAATKPAQTVASASRKPTSNGRKSVKLSKSQVEIARRLGVPLEEYARYVKEA